MGWLSYLTTLMATRGTLISNYCPQKAQDELGEGQELWQGCLFRSSRPRELG